MWNRISHKSESRPCSTITLNAVSTLGRHISSIDKSPPLTSCFSVAMELRKHFLTSTSDKLAPQPHEWLTSWQRRATAALSRVVAGDCVGYQGRPT